MPRPPYQDEGIFGPGGAKFVAALLAIAVLGGIAVLALNVDFGEVADTLDTTDEPSTEQPGGTDAPAGRGDGGSGDGAETAEAPPTTLSASRLAAALSALRERVGGNSDLVRVRAMPDGIELDVRRGNRPVGYSWSDGELTELQVVVVAGSGSLKRRDFLASTVDPSSLGRLLRGAKRHAGGRELEVDNATLGTDLIKPDRLRWLLNAEAPNGSSLTFRAKRDGRGVQNLGSSGPPGAGLPAGAREQFRDAERFSECVEDAAGDSAAILECTQGLTP
jgi:hypothetical protein